VEISKLEIGFAPRCQWTLGNLPLRSTDVIESGIEITASKMSNLR